MADGTRRMEGWKEFGEFSDFQEIEWFVVVPVDCREKRDAGASS